MYTSGLFGPWKPPINFFLHEPYYHTRIGESGESAYTLDKFQSGGGEWIREVVFVDRQLYVMD
jgi:hypothetical protein